MSGEVTANSIVTTSEINAGTTISVDGLITAGTTLTADGNITSGGNISVDGSITSGGIVSATEGVYGGFLGHPTRVKIIWNDFQTDNDDLGGNIHIKDVSVVPTGLSISDSDTEVYASVQIPWGYRVTGYCIYASASLSVTLYESYIGNATSSSRHTGGTTNAHHSAFTPISATSENFITIYIVTTSTSQVIYGGYLEIELYI